MSVSKARPKICNDPSWLLERTAKLLHSGFLRRYRNEAKTWTRHWLEDTRGSRDFQKDIFWILLICLPLEIAVFLILILTFLHCSFAWSKHPGMLLLQYSVRMKSVSILLPLLLLLSLLQIYYAVLQLQLFLLFLFVLLSHFKPVCLRLTLKSPLSDSILIGFW